MCLWQHVGDFDRVDVEVFANRFALECVFEQHVIIIFEHGLDIVKFVIFGDRESAFISMALEDDQVMRFHNAIIGVLVLKDAPQLEFGECAARAEIAISLLFVLQIRLIVRFSFRCAEILRHSVLFGERVMLEQLYRLLRDCHIMKGVCRNIIIRRN